MVSYFLGNDPKKWRPNVPVWGGVRYVDLYPGVDLEFSGEGGRLAQRFVVRDAAGAGAQSPAVLRNAHLRVEGASSLSLAGDGPLTITTEVGDLKLDLAQVVTAAGSPLPVGEGLGVRSVQANTVTLPFTSARPAADRVAAAGASDLLYSTFLGGSDYDYGLGIAVDGAGSAYVTGGTSSSDLPTTAGAFDPTFNGGSLDAFVAKLAMGGGATSTPTPTPTATATATATPAPGLAPTITSVSPTAGPGRGGILATLSGSNFQGGAPVTFGGRAATEVSVGSATSLTARTPAHSRAVGDVNGNGSVTSLDALCILRAVASLPATTSCPAAMLTSTVDVVVANPDGQNGTLAAGFTYQHADVNGSGTVTSVDALCVLRQVAALPATSACPAPPAPLTPTATPTVAPPPAARPRP